MLRVSFGILFFLSCLSHIELCDHYEDKTCIIHPNYIDFHKQFTLETILKDIAYDLYFHKKITYGVKITDYETNWEDWHCYFVLYKENYQEVVFPLEGRRIFESSLWCFDYLGSLILEFYKKNHLENKTLDMNFLSYEMSFMVYKKNNLKKTLKRNIELKNLY